MIGEVDRKVGDPKFSFAAGVRAADAGEGQSAALELTQKVASEVAGGSGDEDDGGGEQGRSQLEVATVRVLAACTRSVVNAMATRTSEIRQSVGKLVAP